MTSTVPALTERQLRDVCRELVVELGLAGALNPHDLCLRLASRRGRDIVLEPQRIPGADGAGFGALLPLHDKDVIVYPADVSPPWQGHVIYHEVMHIVRDHAGDGHLLCGAEVELAAEAEKPGSGSYFRRWTEWEAETGATILSELTDRGPLLVDAAGTDLSAAEQAYARAVGGRFRRDVR